MVAQLVECWTSDHVIVGLNPTVGMAFWYEYDTWIFLKDILAHLSMMCSKLIIQVSHCLLSIIMFRSVSTIWFKQQSSYMTGPILTTIHRNVS